MALAGLALLIQGLFGGGPASSRITAMGLGSLLVFVGVALSARYVVRPLAAVVGWPLQRLGHATGELARENATRNPARTAVTAAALMVGLALVVFVSVFAAGLKDSIDGAIADRAKAELVVTSDTVAPLSRAAGARIDRVPSVMATAPQYLDQVQVNGRKSNAVTDQLTGIDPLTLRDAYSFRWLHGSDADLQRLVGGAAIVEEQFAKAHGITVGKRFRVTGPTGHGATLTAIAEYRDPELMQGVMVDVAQFRALSSLRDPLSYFVTLVPGTDTPTAQRQVKAALAQFPSAKVRTRAQYSDYIGAQLDQIVYLLYALLAMSIVISMFGIANSLFLSIHERTRELGMLRAIGATAAQVRRMIRYESVITSLIGGVLGTARRDPLRLADDVRGQGPRRRLQHPGGPARGLPRARRRRRGPWRRRAGTPRGAPADPGRRAQRVRRSARDVEPRRLLGRAPADGQRRLERGSGAQGRSHAQRSAHQLDALADAEEPEALVVGVGHEARAIVAHDDGDRVRALRDRDMDADVTRVLDRIREALLHETVDRDLELGSVALWLAAGLIAEVDLGRDGQARQPPRAVDERLERRARHRARRARRGACR